MEELIPFDSAARIASKTAPKMVFFRADYSRAADANDLWQHHQKLSGSLRSGPSEFQDDWTLWCNLGLQDVTDKYTKFDAFNADQVKVKTYLAWQLIDYPCSIHKVVKFCVGTHINMST